MGTKKDLSTTNTTSVVIERALKECRQCGKLYDNPVSRSTFCDNRCKQAAYRHRKEMKESASEPDVIEIKPVAEAPKVVNIPKLIPSPIYQEQAALVKSVRSNLDGDEVKKTNKQKELTELKQKDPHFAAYVTAVIMSIVLLVIVLGAIYLIKRKYKKGGYDLYAGAGLISLALIAFINLVVRGEGVKAKREVAKADGIKALTIEIDELTELIDSKKPILAFAEQTLKTISATVPEPFITPANEEVKNLPAEAKKALPVSVMTASELRGKTFDLLTVSEEYAQLFGQPEQGFAMAVHGAPGQGKSTFVVNLAYALAVDNGKGMYFSAEEGFSQSMKDKIAGFETDDLLLSNHRTLADVEQILQQDQYNVVVLDSIQQIGLNADELRALRERYPSTSFIYILQARKDGKFKGDNRFAHDADIEIKLEGRVPHRIKSRYLKTMV